MQEPEFGLKEKYWFFPKEAIILIQLQEEQVWYFYISIQAPDI